MYTVYITYLLGFGILTIFSGFVIWDYRKSKHILDEVTKNEEKT